MLDKIFLFIKIFLIVLLSASSSYAGSSLAWDPPDTGTVNGYRIYYGLTSGNYSDKVDAGNVTQYELSGLSLKDNTEYFFAVRAYNDAGESGDSNEISWKSGDSTPPLNPQGLNLENTPEGIKLVWAANTESDLNSYNICYSTISRQYGSFIPAEKMTSFTIPLSYLEAGKTYYFAVKAIDTAGNESGPSAEVNTTILKPDTIAPQVAIASPTTARTIYKTNESSISLSGTASDDIKVTKVSWTNSTGDSGTANGTTNWFISDITLQEGTNEIAVTAEDAAGNKGRQSLNVTYLPPDTISPVVSFVSPTSASSYAADKNTVNISGTASDNTGVTKVTWSSSTGGSGTANGTTNWSISDITLQEGTNEITVTAEDASGNSGSKTLTITYSSNSDIIKPTITITSPKSRGRSIKRTKKQYLDMSGTASDNKGVVQVHWENSSGSNGIASGTDGWTVSDLELTEGKNIITITAVDAAGNEADKKFSIIYTP